MSAALPALAGEVLAKGEATKAGPVGLGVILLLCIACYFLFKSMSKHMRNVRDNFPADGVPQRPHVRRDTERRAAGAQAAELRSTDARAGDVITPGTGEPSDPDTR